MKRPSLAEIAAFVAAQPLAVQASLSEGGGPQAAVVGIVSNQRCELFFDTLDSTRKCQNLRRDPRVSVVVGWDLAAGRTVQLEGLADEPRLAERTEWLRLYLARFPDGATRQSWAGITYFRVRPTWLRYSDFTAPQPIVVEYSSAELTAADRGPPA